MFDHKLQEYLYLASPLHLKGGAHIVQYIGWETRHKQHCSVYIDSIVSMVFITNMLQANIDNYYCMIKFISSIVNSLALHSLALHSLALHSLGLHSLALHSLFYLALFSCLNYSCNLVLAIVCADLSTILH